ncbi:MAG: AAA family ATPase [Candidatus Thiodiazotropha taylori]|nr:AAA family ATPase [Candidatus Thiodiazotropha taylori]MCG8071230.1 AAA family ATPase [Candidatus Thiodiazotropha taylori]MCW4321638.1 AAA family ATPase [Candidatus Thiodiazotropha taylori]MCW4325243.1 AAA family ATPase [Candidatus Thiodiazotropha taylori]
MSRYQDATGYLIELRTSINEGWFSALCDMALNSNGQSPTDEQLAVLWEHLHQLQPYNPVAIAPPPAIPAIGGNQPPAFLEELSGFSGFKKLSNGLEIRLDKQITLIFGKNGSGKSSICQALKVLANPERPDAPLHNVRSTTTTVPSFKYRFSGATTVNNWSEASGYGIHSQAIKYFDSTIAIRHTTGNIQPEESVEISSFRQEVFEYAREYLRAFRNYALQQVNTEEGRIQTAIEELKRTLTASVDIAQEPFLSWSPTNCHSMAAWLAELPIFDTTREAELNQLTAVLEQHLAAASEEGLRALRAQLTLVNQLQTKLTQLNQYCLRVPLTALQGAEQQLIQKEAAIKEFSANIFPAGSNTAHYNDLVTSASLLTEYANATADRTECPLCQRTLDVQGENLFKAYNAHLTSTLQSEIATLTETLRAGITILGHIRSFELGDYSACQDRFQDGFLAALGELIGSVQNAIPTEGASLETGNAAIYQRATEIPQYLQTVNGVKTQIEATIKTATESKESLDSAIKQLQAKIGQLRAHQAVCVNRQIIETLCQEGQTYVPFGSRVRFIDFTTMLRNMTIKGKEAHNELVMDSFEQKLAEEYVALSGVTHSDMGVLLATRGDDRDVIVTPKIGDNHVHRVLSEGELKVHALALFMCEASTSPHQILIFDDPVTSFDYNYISNFCERLRNHVRDQRQTQVIVLTHNWDFFAHLQTVLNKSHGLNARLSVQVLEDCATVGEYSQKWDELCLQIETIVLAVNEPSDIEKERLSGLMRRLIERFTNAYVFNEQRHQYKVKTLKISEFREFTKVVPLLEQEADELRDLFSNLSPPEHDDIRNFYVTKTKAQFNTWYNRIVAIKDAVESRRP